MQQQELRRPHVAGPVHAPHGGDTTARGQSIKQRKPGQQHRAKDAHHQRMKAHTYTHTNQAVHGLRTSCFIELSRAFSRKQANRPSKRSLDCQHTRAHKHTSSRHTHSQLSLDKQPTAILSLYTGTLQCPCLLANQFMRCPSRWTHHVSFECTTVHTLTGSTNPCDPLHGADVLPHVRCTLPP